MPTKSSMIFSPPDKLHHDANGVPIISPDTLITHVREINNSSGSRNFRVFQSRSTANITMSIFPLWTHELPGVTISRRLLFEHVPLHRVLISHWLKSNDKLLGGLLFPRGPFEMASLCPFVQILKHGLKGVKSEDTESMEKRYDHLSFVFRGEPVDEDDDERFNERYDAIPPTLVDEPPEKMIKVDLTLFVSRRELCSSTELQPFDADGAWNPESYVVWCDLYDHFAPIMQEECAALKSNILPASACNLLRRVMHTHFDDFGIVFGKVWWNFGLCAMIPCARVNLRSFMRGMLTDMFMVYHMLPSPPPVLTLFNPRSNAPGQRMCACCLALMLGKGQMMRCPCGQVYYCDDGCQKAHWKVHRLVCGGKKKNNKKVK